MGIECHNLRREHYNKINVVSLSPSNMKQNVKYKCLFDNLRRGYYRHNNQCFN